MPISGAARTASRTRFVRAILPAIVLGAALAPLAGSAQAAPFQTCATLKGKHLKSGGRAVVVTQLVNREAEREGTERVAYVCASPHARAWRVGSISNPITPQITVVAGAGEWVVLAFERTSGILFEARETAANAANGKHFQLWSISGGEGQYSGNVLEAVKLDSHGRLALITGVPGSPSPEPGSGPIVKRNVLGVAPSGKRTLLDSAPTASIPTASLQLVGGVVHWTDAGVARSAQP